MFTHICTIHAIAITMFHCSYYCVLLLLQTEAAALVKGGGRAMSLEQMANATRGLPEFQEQTKKMSQHINMAQACSAKIGSMDLLRVGAIEQTMALGTDDVSNN
jgi:Sec1 family